MQTHIELIQEQYYKLRGQFAAGRLTESEFDTALHDLALQDTQGTYWMIGANTGNWYYFDGIDWVEGDPSAREFPALPGPEPMPAPGPVSAVDHLPAPNLVPTPIEKEMPTAGRSLALPFLVSALVLVVVGVIAFLLFDGNQVAVGNAAELPTRIIPSTIVALKPSPHFSPVPTRTPTRISVVVSAENPIPVTVTPPALVIEPTSTAPVLTSIPTITRSAPVTNVAGDNSQFNDTVFEVPTPGAPQGSFGLPPDVYVTGINVSPNPPRQRQEITFTASFLNTNPVSVGMEWRVVFLDPAKSGRNKDWGQSQLVGAQIPPGRSEFSLVYIPVTSNGPCVTLQVLAARRLQDNGRFLLPGPGGGPYSTMMTFC